MDATDIWKRFARCADDRSNATDVLAHIRELHGATRGWNVNKHPRTPLRARSGIFREEWMGAVAPCRYPGHRHGSDHGHRNRLHRPILHAGTEVLREPH